MTRSPGAEALTTWPVADWEDVPAVQQKQGTTMVSTQTQHANCSQADVKAERQVSTGWYFSIVLPRRLLSCKSEDET